MLAKTHGGGAERIDALLDQVGLAKDAKRKVKAYSTGMRQRLGVAAALLGDPEIVILDEPVNGLDVAGIQEMRRLIRSLAADHGKTVFLSSHLLSEVQQVCDRVAIINKGEVVRESTVAGLLDQERRPQGRGRAGRGGGSGASRRTGRWSGTATALVGRRRASRGAGGGAPAGRGRRRPVRPGAGAAQSRGRVPRHHPGGAGRCLTRSPPRR